MASPLRLDLLCASGTVTSARGAVEPRRRPTTSYFVRAGAGAQTFMTWRTWSCCAFFAISALTLATRIWLASEPQAGRNSEPAKLIQNSSSTVVNLKPTYGAIP